MIIRQNGPRFFGRLFLELGIAQKTIGVEPTRLRFLELNYLQQAAPKARFVSAAGVVEETTPAKRRR